MRLACPKGFALLELLVAFLLVSAGTIAFMQTQFHQTTVAHHLKNQLQAGLLIDDLRRKLDTLTKPLPNISAGFEMPPPTTVNCRQAFCNETQLANFYLSHWKCRLGKWSSSNWCQTQFGTSGLLAHGDAKIQQSTHRLLITLRWKDLQQQNQTQSFTYVIL